MMSASSYESIPPPRHALSQGKSVCELSKLIDKGTPITEEELRFVGACVVQATATLHRECHVLYRNYLPENLFLQVGGCAVIIIISSSSSNSRQR